MISPRLLIFLGCWYFTVAARVTAAGISRPLVFQGRSYSRPLVFQGRSDSTAAKHGVPNSAIRRVRGAVRSYRQRMDRLHVLADELTARARRVEALGDELVTHAAQALWTSVAADAFREQVQRRRLDIRHIAGRLDDAAAQLRQLAQLAAERRHLLVNLAGAPGADVVHRFIHQVW